MSLPEFRLFLKDRTVQHFTGTEDGYLLLDYLEAL
jgi:hypothetical protein